MIDPRMRQRVQTVSVRSTVDRTLTNHELVQMWETAWGGDRMGRDVFARYRRHVLDAIRYFVNPETGAEVPVRDWTKEGLWEYLQFVENNYCAYFRNTTFGKATPIVTCNKDVWKGNLPVSEALATCAECPLFKRPSVEQRENGLAHWFRHLSILGVIPHNIMHDVREARRGQVVEVPRGERRRNPTVEEMRKLVNETAHPQRRAFYACSAKWYYRPNEMLRLDRYASFGVPMPEGHRLPPGFERAFQMHPEVAPFDQGGDMVYVPYLMTPQGVQLREKRKGNRWMVIDAEIRPILEQQFAYWEAHVARDETGRPLHTKLWINQYGLPLAQSHLYLTLFKADCLRLGLVKEEEAGDPLREWTGHCQRHFAERLSVELGFPDVWAHHFRGDKLGNARDHYYEPEPLAVRKAYHELMPRLGFTPLAEAPKVRDPSERDLHRAILAGVLARAREEKKGGNHVLHRVSVDGEAWMVPAKLLPSVLFALRQAERAPVVEAGSAARRVWVAPEIIMPVCERALGFLV